MVEPGATPSRSGAGAVAATRRTAAPRRSRRRLGALGGVMLVALAAASWLGWRRARPPQRCAEGMVALGPRCCGLGQRLQGQRCVGRPTRCAAGLRVTEAGCQPVAAVVRVPAGELQLGPADWEGAGRVAPYRAHVAAFGIDAHEITEEAYDHCVAAGACASLPKSGEPGLPRAGITVAEAARYCRWRSGALPTRDQLAFAAMGEASRRYPWGDTGAVCRRVAFGLLAGPCATGATGAELAGSHPDGATANGIQDLAGNVAEWVSGGGGQNEQGEARGGSWQSGAASELRGWSFVRLPVDARSAAVGFRCSYPATRGRER